LAKGGGEGGSAVEGPYTLYAKRCLTKLPKALPANAAKLPTHLKAPPRSRRTQR